MRSIVRPRLTSRRASCRCSPATSNSSNTIVAGNVISQGPAAGTTVDADSAIYFVSPTGPAWVGGTVMIEGCDTGVVNDGRIQAANLLTDRGDIGRDERI